VRRSGARPEIYAYGVRNPYRLSFDADTGDLWLADVGHSCWEEVDHEPEGGPAGWNFGWALREGNHKFLGDGPESLVPPVFEYPHRNGWCVIIGGFVYRGAAMPALDGAYLFTDYCRGQLVALRLPAGQPPTLTDTGVQINNPIALMPDPQGEPILLSLDGDVARVVPRK
jgi:glucose/arabinose dehydrogenase